MVHGPWSMVCRPRVSGAGHGLGRFSFQSTDWWSYPGNPRLCQIWHRRGFRGTRYEVRGTRHEVRGTRYEVRLTTHDARRASRDDGAPATEDGGVRAPEGVPSLMVGSGQASPPIRHFSSMRRAM